MYVFTSINTCNFNLLFMYESANHMVTTNMGSNYSACWTNVEETDVTLLSHPPAHPLPPHTSWSDNII